MAAAALAARMLDVMLCAQHNQYACAMTDTRPYMLAALS
jgi:hypothetical protein